MVRVKRLGKGTTSWKGGSITGGETDLVPRAVFERYPHKFKIIEEAQEPAPPEVVTTAVSKPAKTRKSTPKAKKGE